MTAATKHVRPYTTRTGAKQFKPSIQLAMALNSRSSGFCLACGDEQNGVEPDARKYRCTSCGKHKVYGGEELVLMGLTFDAEK